MRTASSGHEVITTCGEAMGWMKIKLNRHPIFKI